MTPHDVPAFLDERGHVPAAAMSRYVDGISDLAERARVTHHLADCDECREELTALRRLVPRRAPMTRPLVALFGLAASLAIIMLPWRGMLDTRNGESLPHDVRAQESVAENDVPFPVASPADDALLTTDGVRLTWHLVGAEASYEVVLYDESGGVVYSGATTDTSAIVPSRALAKRKSGDTSLTHTYHWRVEARLLDGRSANTGLHRIRVR